MMFMKNYSLWEDIEKVKDCKRLDKDLEVDVLIIGGGITGISLLYNLKETNLKVILVERNKCGYGVTSKSTAKITYLQEKIYMNIRKFVNEDMAFKYLKSQRDGVMMLKNIIEKENIDCDFRQANSYVFTNDNTNIKKINEEYIFLKKAHIEVKRIKKLEDIPIKSGIEVNDTYVFHPLKFINYFKNKYYDSIYEKTKVDKINKVNDYYVCTANGFQIKAKYVVIATHYPYFLKQFILPMKSYIETSYIGAKEADYKNISAINIDKPTISLRYHSDGNNSYLIYLYNSFKAANIKHISNNYGELEKRNDFQYIWSNNDIITNDYIPYIGSINEDNTMFIATGYNTWGFTNATIAGMLITDIILKRANPYVSLFAPKRKLNLSKLWRFPLDLGSNIKAFIKSTKNNVNNNKVIYKTINKDRVAIYKDRMGEHIVYNRCPHLKCGLIFNEVEKTWDCLCHGSRFDIDGKCIEGPSNYDITYKK